MGNADKYRANAVHCFRMANKAPSPHDEQTRLNMVAGWAHGSNFSCGISAIGACSLMRDHNREALGPYLLSMSRGDAPLDNHA